MNDSLRLRARELGDALVGLDPGSDDALKCATVLLDLIEELVPIEPYSSGHPLWTNVNAPTGQVVAAGFARQSLLNVSWVVRFARRLLELAQGCADGEPLKVLYPACGPSFSPLLVAMLAIGAERFSATLIDISGVSLGLARDLVSALELQAGVADVVHADACGWTTDLRFDVLLLGAPLAGLAGEPQLAMASNLVPFLTAAGTMIPAAMNVVLGEVHGEDELGIVAGQATQESPGSSRRLNRRDIRELFRLDRESAMKLGRPSTWTSAALSLPAVEGPVTFGAGYYPALVVRLSVDGNHFEPDAIGAAPVVKLMPLLPDVGERGWSLYFDAQAATGFQLIPR